MCKQFDDATINADPVELYEEARIERMMRIDAEEKLDKIKSYIGSQPIENVATFAPILAIIDPYESNLPDSNPDLPF